MADVADEAASARSALTRGDLLKRGSAAAFAVSMRSPSLVERSAAAARSSAVRQPPRRRITYVSIRPPRGRFDPSKVGRNYRSPNRRNYLGFGPGLPVLEQSEPAGGGDRLAARAGTELAPDRGHVVVHRSRGEKQPLGDVRVAQAVGDEPEDLEQLA